MVVGLMQNNNNTNSDNLLNQTPNDAARQAKIPDERTSEAGYQKLPLKFRPKAGRAQRDPIDYDSHPYPIMKEFAEFLALRFDTPRTRHSYYRQMRLVHELCDCDPALITEELYRSYILHVKSITTTMIYLHLAHRSEQDSRELVEKLCQKLPR